MVVVNIFDRNDAENAVLSLDCRGLGSLCSFRLIRRHGKPSSHEGASDCDAAGHSSGENKRILCTHGKCPSFLHPRSTTGTSSIMASSITSKLDEHIESLREGNTLTENEVKALCDQVGCVGNMDVLLCARMR